MSSFHKVAVLGKGLLGTAVVEQLAKAGFAVTVLSRDPSKIKDLPTGVNAVGVDYSSTDSIAAALRGQDVVVSTVGSSAHEVDKRVVDAAIIAGVKRVIPSNFGSFTTDPEAQRTLPFIGELGKTQEYLAAKGEQGLLEWTILSTGAFFEVSFSTPAFLNIKDRSIKLYNGGKQRMSVSSVVTIGKAIAGVLAHPEETKNRTLFIHDTTLSQDQMLRLSQKFFKGDWTVTEIDGESAWQSSLAKAQNGDNSIPTTYALLVHALCLGKFNSAYESVDNELLGLGFLSDDELEAKVAAIAGQV